MSAVGLHARPASPFTRVASACGQQVTIARDGSEPLPSLSILMVAALDLRAARGLPGRGGSTAEPTLNEPATLLATDLDTHGKT